jgi:hypothetical protein
VNSRLTADGAVLYIFLDEIEVIAGPLRRSCCGSGEIGHCNCKPGCTCSCQSCSC